MAPIILKDVQIGLEPGSIKYEWSLEQAVSDTLLQDKFRQMTAFISNPEWIINSHMYWKHRKTLSFHPRLFLSRVKISRHVILLQKIVLSNMI